MIRRAVLIVLACCAAGAAVAQSRSYTVTLTDADMSVVSRALGRHPYDEAAPVISRISQQIQAQVAGQGPSSPPAAEKPAAEASPSPAK